MSLLENKKSPLIAVRYLKKRLRRITAMGFHNLMVNEMNFIVHFTLHRNETTVAFYTSESIENQRSPEWSYLEFPLSVQCLQDFVMRVWITSFNQCRLFLQYDIHLDDSLVPDEQKERVTKGNNTLWLEIFHYRFTDSENDPILPLPTKQRNDSTLSYNKLSIIRMNNTINSIRTDNHTSVIYLQQIRKCLEMNQEYLEKIKERECRQVRIATLKQYLQFQIHLNQKRLSINQQKQRLLDERKIQLIRSLPQIRFQEEECSSTQHRLAQSKSILHQLLQIIHYRQREIITEIYHYIYPISHENQKGFFIANVNLPPAEDKIYQSASIRDRDQEIAAAIGYCSHFLLIISQVIHLPLRFPIDYHGIPIIKIYDNTLDANEFPLYPTTNLSAFRYGFYLLNRNLGQIMYHCQVSDQNTDFRNTLENLKELLEEYFLHPHQNGVLMSHDTQKLDPNQRQQIMASVQQQLAVQNAQELLQKLSDKCFKACVQKPGSSLSSSEQKCITQCSDRYMDAWNIVSRTYAERIKREQHRS